MLINNFSDQVIVWGKQRVSYYYKTPPKIHTILIKTYYERLMQVECTNGCPFNNYNCMCQFCEDQCNDGLNCFECKHEGKIMHSIYLCTGFSGDVVRYIEHWKRGKADEEKLEQEGTR